MQVEIIKVASTCKLKVYPTTAWIKILKNSRVLLRYCELLNINFYSQFDQFFPYRKSGRKGHPTPRNRVSQSPPGRHEAPERSRYLHGRQLRGHRYLS